MNIQTDHTSEQANRRQAERHRTLKHARIILSNRMSTFDCIVRNISAMGAMLEIAAPMGIPSHFELAIGDAIHGPASTIRWRTDHAMGVSFDDAWQKAA
jgi:PilZ domain